MIHTCNACMYVMAQYEMIANLILNLPIALPGINSPTRMSLSRRS